MLKDNSGKELKCVKIQNLDIPVLCPDCQIEMKIRDSKRRIIKLIDATRLYINLKRYRCSCCGSVHTELPDFLLPYKQYPKTIIDKAIMGDTEKLGIDNSTIRYWMNRK